MSRGSSVADRGSRHRPVGDCGGRIIGGSSRRFRHRDGPGEEATMNEGCRVRVTGPLAGYVDGFRDELAAQGYTVQVRDRQLRMLAHVSRWMAGQGLSVAELTPDLLEDFLDERRREGYHHALSRRAVMPLMEHCASPGCGAVSVGGRPRGRAGPRDGGLPALSARRAGADPGRGGQVHAAGAGVPHRDRAGWRASGRACRPRW